MMIENWENFEGFIFIVEHKTPKGPRWRITDEYFKSVDGTWYSSWVEASRKARKNFPKADIRMN